VVWRGWWAGWARPGGGGASAFPKPYPSPRCVVASSRCAVDDADAACVASSKSLVGDDEAAAAAGIDGGEVLEVVRDAML